MKSNLYNLIDLQKVDSKLRSLESLKGDLPQRVNALKAELEQVKKDNEQQLSDLKETRRLKLHWEGELSSLQVNLKKIQEQLYAVTTNRQYDAITVEIETIEEKISDAETKILEFITLEEELTKDSESSSSKIEILQEDIQKNEKELNEKIRSTEDEFQDYNQKRAELVSQIKKPVLYQYERIRKAKGDTAVVEIKKYLCCGCFSTIPPQKAVEIRNMDQLILCESCGRILVHKNDKSKVSILR